MFLLGSSYDVTGATQVGSSDAVLAFLSGSVAQATGALAISGGTLDFSTGSAISVPTLTQSSGTLTGNDTVAVTGLTTWTGGTMSGSGTTIAQGGLQLGTSNYGGYEDLDARTLTNMGTATWLGGNYLDQEDGSSFNNLIGATFEFQSGGYWSNNDGTAALVNQGTLNTDAGSSTVYLYTDLDNIGSIAVQSGGLWLYGELENSGSFAVQSGGLALAGYGTATGSFGVATGASLAFDSYEGIYSFGTASVINGGGMVSFGGYYNSVIDDAGAYAVTGPTQVSAGDVNFVSGGTALMGALGLSGGTLNFSTGSQVSVASLTMTGGTLTGSDTVVVSGPTTWTGGVMSGTGVTTAEGGLTLGDVNNQFYDYEYLVQRTLNNAGGATWNGPGYFYQQSGSVINNMAGATFSLQSDSPWYDDADDDTFNNQGTLTIAAGTGTLYFYTTLNNTGSLEVVSGTFDLVSSVTQLSGTTLTGGSWIVGADSSLNLGASLTELAATVALQGPGASLSGLSSLSTIDPNGELVVQGGDSFSLPGNLDNAGTIDLAPGTLNVAGDYTQESTGTLAVGIGGTTSGSQFGQLNVTGQSALDGTLSISLIDQFIPQVGESDRILTFGSRTNDFGVEIGLYLGEGEGLIPTYDSSGLDLVVSSTEIDTTTAVVSSLNPSEYGQTITFTATLTPAWLSSDSPTGDVTFYDGSTELGSAPVADDSASFATSALSVGSHSIIAEYSGDSNFNASESLPLLQNVNQAGTQTDLESSSDPSLYGDDVSFSASVSSTVTGIGPPTGQVTFYDGSTALDTETLISGSASFTTSALAVGDHMITASYGGDTDFAGDTSNAVSQTVQAPPPATLNGEVYNDANGSGTVTAGAGLFDWTLNLLGSSNQVVATTTTDTSGDYSFSGVSPGSYTVAVAGQTGYVPTVPSSGTLTVQAGQGQTINNLDFGEFQTVSVSGEVFDDLNDSGSFNPNDPGLSGWTVNLLNGSSSVVQTTTTDSSGDYSFTNLGPGTFTLAEVVPTGFAPTGSSSGSYSITTSSGMNISGDDFGNLEGPSLSVTGLAITPASGLQSGASFVVSWQDTDSGQMPIDTSFTDRVTVINQTTGQVIAQVTVPYNESAQGSLGVGASVAQQSTFRLPDGDPGVGQIEVTVVANDYGTIPGYYGTASGAATTTENATIAPYPDLQVQNLTVSPTSIVSGSTVQVTWDDANTGNAPVNQAFVDQLTVVNTTTGATLLNTTIGYTPSQPGVGPIDAGSFYQQTASFTMPQGEPGVGNLTITVTTDADNQIYEYNASGTGETNNTSSVTATSTLASYPDLVTSAVQAPASADPGQAISVGWTLTNSGSADANGPWTEQILLATDAAGDDPTLIGAQTFTGTLAANQSVSRTASVVIPSVPGGNYWIVVSENPLGELFELDTTNELAIATQATSVAGALTVTLASPTESDAAGADATTATVTRNTDTTDPLVVTITNSDPTDVTAPQTVTIPAGATSVTFAVGTINNYVVEGTQTATLTASVTGMVSGSGTLTVTDTNVPTLTLALNTHTVNETDPNPAAYGTVTRNTSTSSALTVSLSSAETNKLTVPVTVTIPAGATSATFPVTVVNDGQIDGNETATITASASGFLTGSDSAMVVDDNIPTLTLTLAQTTVSEAAGADATTGTVSIASPTRQPITIVLISSDTTAATVPAYVVIASGQESASFPITAINNGLDIGDQTAVITASVETDAGVVLTQGSADASLLLLNANGPSLTVSFATSAVDKGAHGDSHDHAQHQHH